MHYAKVIADSISPEGVRLTTFEVKTWRFILSEFNTHRALSRNSASSRAIPFGKQVERLLDVPALPVEWPQEKSGMQGGEPLSERAADQAWAVWQETMQMVIDQAGLLRTLGEQSNEMLHKSVVNRLLEPWMWHTIVCTATAWENFFDQRCSPLAQPEIRTTAVAMRVAYETSEPQELAEGEWHLPYITDEDRDQVGYGGAQEHQENAIGALRAVSAARCARVSYLTHDGRRDMQADLDLYESLITAQPPHWSPLEHVATPWEWNRQEGCIHFGQTVPVVEDDFTCIPIDHLPRVGNLLGWRSLRTEVEAQQGAVTYR